MSKLKLNEVVLKSPNGLVEKSLSMGDDGIVKVDGVEIKSSNAVTNTELGYLDGVTSPIQTQFTALDTLLFFRHGGSIAGVINFNDLAVNRLYGVGAVDVSSVGKPPESYGSLFTFMGADAIQIFLSTTNVLYTRIRAGGNWTAWAIK